MVLIMVKILFLCPLRALFCYAVISFYSLVLACFSLFQVVLACSCFIALYQYVTTDFAKQLYKALLIAFSANSEKSPFIGFK